MSSSSSSSGKKRSREGGNPGKEPNKKSKPSLPDNAGLQLLSDHGAQLAAEGGKTVFVGYFSFFFLSFFFLSFLTFSHFLLQETQWMFVHLSVSLF